MRLIFLFLFLFCGALLGYAQYLQHVQGLLPCPLCVAQRSLIGWLDCQHSQRIGITQVP